MRRPPGPRTAASSERRTLPISGHPNPRSQSPKAISGSSGPSSESNHVAVPHGQNSLTTGQKSWVFPSSAMCLALAVPLASMRACWHAVSRVFIVDVSFRRVVQICEGHPRPAHEPLPSGERRRQTSDNREKRRSGGEAPTSDGLQESRAAMRRHPANTGASANGAGRPDGDLGKDRRGRHKLDREVTSAKRDPTDQRRPAGTTLWGVTGCNPVRRGDGKRRQAVAGRGKLSPKEPNTKIENYLVTGRQKFR